MDTKLSALPVNALAYDRRLRNARPLFSLEHRLQASADGLRLQRCWTAVGALPVATESLLWRGGLQQVETELPSLPEIAQAHVKGLQVHTVLRSPRTTATERQRTLTLRHPAVTLGSMPLFIAQHWATLLRGEPCWASYLVLKVQRAAAVRVQRIASPRGETRIAVTPGNWLLRAVFGSTVFRFEGSEPALIAIDGLLDPRDLQHNGRWRETLGRIVFSSPVDLRAAREDA